MSRVHIAYRLVHESHDIVQYEVLSPDFSGETFDERLLGVIKINRHSRSYLFFPSDLWNELGFVDVNCLANGSIDLDSRQEGINYAARIHRAISNRIAENDFNCGYG